MSMINDRPGRRGAWRCWWPGSSSPPRSSCSAPRSGSSAPLRHPVRSGRSRPPCCRARRARGRVERAGPPVEHGRAGRRRLGGGGRGGDPARSDHAAAPARPAPGGCRAPGRRARRGGGRRRSCLRGPVRPPGRAPDPRGDARGAPLPGRAARRLRRERRPRQPGRRPAAHPRRVDAPRLAAVPGRGLDRPRRPDGGAELHLGRPRGPAAAPHARRAAARWTPTPTPSRPRSAAELGMLRRAGSPGPAGCGCGCPACSTATRTRARWPTGSCGSHPPCTAAACWRWWSSSGRRTRCRSARADDRALAEVARRLAIVLRNRSLDEALQATLADLRRANADLQASRRRLVTTADAERKRIERDLHDGAQQHLVALAVGIRLVRDSLATATRPRTSSCSTSSTAASASRSPSCATWRTASTRRCCATPAWRRRCGPRRSAARSPSRSSATGLGRHPEQVEAAVYFCCLEALANVGKHAPGASVTITLQAVPGELRFEVADTGPGFDPASTPRARGCRTWRTGSGHWAGRSRGARRRATARSSSAARRCPGVAPVAPAAASGGLGDRRPRSARSAWWPAPSCARGGGAW